MDLRLPQLRGFLSVASLVSLLAANAPAAVFTVTNSDESGPGSLAQAIIDANTLEGADTIAFNIPGAGVHTITLSTATSLVIFDDLTIDGYTQPGAQPNTLAVGDDAIILIQIDGGGPASTVAAGLSFAGGSSTVRGLSLTGFSLTFGAAITAGNGFGDPFSVNVEGNFIGLTPGSTVRGSYIGVTGANVIGGTTPEKRNIISGNIIGVSGSDIFRVPSGEVLGNYIGTDPSGLLQGFGNVTGISGANAGGPEPGAGNVITGNNVGISATGQQTIQGNLIGPMADGSPAFGNGTGIRISGSQNQIGGLGPDEGNVIAYNSSGLRMPIVSLLTVPVENSILGNSFFANRFVGLDLNDDGLTHNDFGDTDSGVNLLQNFPIISAVKRESGSTTVTGGLNGTPATDFTLQFFAGAADSIPPAETLLGTATVTTGVNGDAHFDFTFPTAISENEIVTATATDPGGNTSEFFPQDGEVQFANLSTRGNVGLDDDVMIAGFITSVAPAKTLLIRALGPSLGLPGALADPKLDVFSSQNPLFSHALNDNWRESQEAEILATGLAPNDDREAALIYVTGTVPFSPPNFTAVVSGADGGTGIAIVEIYDLDPPFEIPGTADLINLSTRGAIGTGDDVLIGGIILRGDAPQAVLVRAIGPDLAAAGIGGPLQDPVLEVYDSDANLVASNDDWRSDQGAEITASGLAPNDDRDAAILATLPPFTYTAIVRGKEDASGIGLVEFYKLD